MKGSVAWKGNEMRVDLRPCVFSLALCAALIWGAQNSSAATSLVVQQGLNGYAGSQDTYIHTGGYSYEGRNYGNDGDFIVQVRRWVST